MTYVYVIWSCGIIVRGFGYCINVLDCGDGYGCRFKCIGVFVNLSVCGFMLNGKMVFANCLLKAEAFCWWVMAGLLLKVMIVFGCEGGFVPFR